MKKQPNMFLVYLTLLTISAIFMSANIVPIFGPSGAAYLIGNYKNQYESEGLSKYHILIAMIIGMLSTFLVSYLVFIQIMTDFHGTMIFWFLCITGATLYAAIPIALFFLGHRKAETCIQN